MRPGKLEETLVGAVVISNVAPAVLDALRSGRRRGEGRAIGVVEAKTVTAGIHAADAAVKRADIHLARLVTGQGINGKSFFVVQGEVSSVEEAVSAAVDRLGNRHLDHSVIPTADAAVRAALVGK